jgi:peptidoglycan/LPS O-acetylase OafA/YrhL
MSCAAFIEKREANSLGTLGILFAVIAAVLTIIGVWSDIGGNTFWNSTITLIVVSVTLAYAFLLFMPNLSANHKWAQIAAVISVAALAAIILFMLWSENDNEFYFRLLGVASIVVVFFTLIIPICAKLGGKQTKRIHPPNLSEHLTLNKIADEIYADEFGRKFQVTEIKSDKF